jgi:membrane protein YdbS with pleckstrin-like domain
MLRYQLTIRKPSVTDETLPPGRRDKLRPLKSAIAAFLALSAAIGIFLAALVVGSVFALAIIVVVGTAIVVWVLSRLWRRKEWQGKP